MVYVDERVWEEFKKLGIQCGARSSKAEVTKKWHVGNGHGTQSNGGGGAGTCLNHNFQQGEGEIYTM